LERARPRALDEADVFREPRELQVRHPGLPDVKERPLSAQTEVLVGEREPVGRARHRGEPRPRLGLLLVALVEQDAERGVRAAADPPPELMQLREAESL